MAAGRELPRGQKQRSGGGNVRWIGELLQRLIEGACRWRATGWRIRRPRWRNGYRAMSYGRGCQGLLDEKWIKSDPQAHFSHARPTPSGLHCREAQVRAVRSPHRWPLPGLLATPAPRFIPWADDGLQTHKHRYLHCPRQLGASWAVASGSRSGISSWHWARGTSVAAPSVRVRVQSRATRRRGWLGSYRSCARLCAASIFQETDYQVSLRRSVFGPVGWMEVVMPVECGDGKRGVLRRVTREEWSRRAASVWTAVSPCSLVQAKRFKKAQCPIVERLTNSLMMFGRNNGKKVCFHPLNLRLAARLDGIKAVIAAYPLLAWLSFSVRRLLAHVLSLSLLRSWPSAS